MINYIFNNVYDEVINQKGKQKNFNNFYDELNSKNNKLNNIINQYDKYNDNLTEDTSGVNLFEEADLIPISEILQKNSYFDEENNKFIYILFDDIEVEERLFFLINTLLREELPIKSDCELCQEAQGISKNTNIDITSIEERHNRSFLQKINEEIQSSSYFDEESNLFKYILFNTILIPEDEVSITIEHLENLQKFPENYEKPNIDLLYFREKINNQILLGKVTSKQIDELMKEQQLKDYLDLQTVLDMESPTYDYEKVAELYYLSNKESMDSIKINVEPKFININVNSQTIRSHLDLLDISEEKQPKDFLVDFIKLVNEGKTNDKT